MNFTPISSYAFSIGGSAYEQKKYDYDSLVEKAYESNPVVATCLGIWQRAFAEPRLKAIKADGEESESESINKLLDRPSEDIPIERFMQCAILYAHLGGNAYIYLEENAGKKVVGMKLLHSGICRAARDEGSINYVDYYEVNKNGNWVKVEKRNIIPLYGMYADGENPAESVSPISIIATQSDSLSEAHRYILGVLHNDATPRTFVKLTPGMSTDPEVIADVKQSLSKRISSSTLGLLKDRFTQLFGGRSIGSPIVAEGIEDIKRIGLGLDELNIDAIEKTLETYICGVLGVPPQVAGVKSGLEFSTDNNLENSYYRFIEQSVIPMLNSFARSLTYGLRGRLDEEVEFYFDPNTIAAYRRMSETERMNTFKNVLSIYGYVARGQMTPEVARYNVTRFLGLDENEAEQLLPDELEKMPETNIPADMNNG